MAGYNRIIMVGNLTRDPELKQLPSGQALCRLNIATNRQFKNRQTGDLVQEVCFIDVDVWGAQADSSSKYLQKGRPVLIEGRLKLDSWQDQEGNARSKHSIVADRVVFLSSGAQAETGSESFDNEALEPRNDVERELMNQLDSIKNKQKAVAQTTPKAPKPGVKAPATGSGSTTTFQDTPPFETDLPF